MRDFLTVPDELLAFAEELASYFERYGYTVAVERQSLEYPYTPTMVCKRGTTTMIVEIASSMPSDRMRAWVAYGRSCWSDTRVALGAPGGSPLSLDDHASLRDLGAGIYIDSPSGIVEAVSPADLAVNLVLPDLSTYAPKVRKALGGAFEQIQRGNWREGFEDGCVALEEAARRYLERHVATGRISWVSSKGKVINRTPSQIERMTLGQLKDAFLAIQNPNLSDSKIAAVLKKLNPDRIRVAHKKRSQRAEQALRRNVGRQVWLLVAGLKELLS
jgi:hypothetical protein